MLYQDRDRFTIHMIARFTPKYSIPVVGKEVGILLQDMFFLLKASLLEIKVISVTW